MGAASWRPGTSRWAYLNTGVYLILLAVGLPLAIAVHTESGWVLFSIIMLGGVCNTTGAWLARRHARRTTPAAPAPAPHH
jgi:hypothetical protein